MKQSNLPKIEADTHKDVLEQRDRRKQKGKTKHSGKKRQDTKWFDRWD